MKTHARNLLILISAMIFGPFVTTVGTLSAQQIQISTIPQIQSKFSSPTSRSILETRDVQSTGIAMTQNDPSFQQDDVSKTSFHSPSIPDFHLPSSDYLVSVIVEFQEIPSVVALHQSAVATFNQQKATRLPDITNYQQPVYQLLNDVERLTTAAFKANPKPKSSQNVVTPNALSNSKSSQNVVAASDLLQEKNFFYKTFHGVTITVPASIIPALSGLSYVKTVHPNKPVSNYLTESVSQIKADVVWEEYETRGEGMVIGVIDSGADYTHPALGGGIGPEFKIIDGYDFVDDDADPMDLNGHGTHVAGIIAANSTWTAKSSSASSTTQSTTTPKSSTASSTTQSTTTNTTSTASTTTPQSTDESPETPIFGVAPDASLIIYRVLNEKGNGLTSDVIAAIERSVDPNKDGDISDRLDVVNMSLGSDNGSPHDASSIAVNNAVEAGVIFVVAAGNSGYVSTGSDPESNHRQNGSQTIGSPGTAQNAITVGAIDRDASLARFSSKGPIHNTFALKPDILAPGVLINSTFLGGTLKSLSGTSMASPHIAGVVALMRKINPDWTPAQIKSALTGSAVKLDMPSWHQGNGLVDAQRAMSQKTLVSPTNLSFGMSNSFVTNWNKTQSVTIQNLTEQDQNYTVQIPSLPAGVTITATPSQITIESGATSTIDIKINVDHFQVPIVQEDIRTYSGYIQISSDTELVNMPWSFSRSSIIRLNYSRPGAATVFTSPTDYYTSYGTNKFNQFHWITPQQAEIYAAVPGNFTSVTVFNGEDEPTRVVVMKDQIFGGSTSTYSYNHGAAIHPVTISATDQNGRSLTTYDRTVQLLNIELMDKLATISAPSEITDGTAFFIAPIDESTSIYATQIAVLEGDVPTLAVPKFRAQRGASGPINFTNSSYPMHHFPLEFKTGTPNIDQDIIALTGAYHKNPDFDHMYSQSVIVLSAETDDDGMARVNYFTANNIDNGDLFAATQFLLGIEESPEIYKIQLETRPLTYWDGNMITNLPGLEELVHTEYLPESTIQFGIGPVYAMSRTDFNIFGLGSIKFSPLIRSPLNELRYSDYDQSTYSVVNMNNDVLYQGSLANIDSDIMVPAERTSLILNLKGHVLRGAPSLTRVISTSDLSQFTVNPPWIYTVQIQDEQKHARESFEQGSSMQLIFTGKSVQLMSVKELAPELTQVWWKIHDGTPDDDAPIVNPTISNDGWISVPYTYSDPANPALDGIKFTADLTQATAIDSVAIDIRFFVSDSTGSTTEMIISPAVAIGNWQGKTGTGIEDPGQNNGMPDRIELSQNYPNPFNPTTNIQFNIPQSQAFQHVRLTVFDLLGREVVRLADGPMPAGRHIKPFQAQNLASGMYIYRLDIGSTSLTRKMLFLK